MNCRIHGNNQRAFIVCSHIVEGEPCKDIVVEIDEDDTGEAVCEREHWDYERDRVIGKLPTVLCEGCAMEAVKAAREAQAARSAKEGN